MACKYSEFEAEDGRYACSVSGDGCMFMIPNSKLCSEMYGEGPDAEIDKCEDCENFYLENSKRCCKEGREHYIDGKFRKSKFLYNITCCGGFLRK